MCVATRRAEAKPNSTTALRKHGGSSTSTGGHFSNRNVPTGLRLKLFDAVVTPTVLYGMAALPLTAAQLQRLDAVQRRMLRNIAGWVRLDGEPWDETMRRMRARLAAALRQHPVGGWTESLCQRRWDHAWHVAHRPSCWPMRTACWHPGAFRDPAAVVMPCRSRGRPLTRWDDTLSSFSRHALRGASWQEAAAQRTHAEWSVLRDDYVQYCMM